MRSTLTIKGQVTIPKDVRTQLGLTPGDAVEFAVTNEGVTLRKKVDRKRMRSVIGCYAGKMKDLSIQDLIDDLRGPAELPPPRRKR